MGMRGCRKGRGTLRIGPSIFPPFLHVLALRPLKGEGETGALALKKLRKVLKCKGLLLNMYPCLFFTVYFVCFHFFGEHRIQQSKLCERFKSITVAPCLSRTVPADSCQLSTDSPRPPSSPYKNRQTIMTGNRPSNNEKKDIMIFPQNLFINNIY